MAFHTFAYAVEAVYKLFLTLNPVGRQVNYLIFYFSKSTVKSTSLWSYWELVYSIVVGVDDLHLTFHSIY